MKTLRKQRKAEPTAPAPRGRETRSSRRVITSDDRRRLGSLAADEEGRSESRQIAALEAQLEDAGYVERDQIPVNVVRMNSAVELANLSTGDSFVAVLAYPDEVEFIDDAVSVLEPLGLALLGASVGDLVQRRGKSGAASFRIASIIHQPEPNQTWR